jgi:hypothetical protein
VCFFSRRTQQPRGQTRTSAIHVNTEHLLFGLLIYKCVNFLFSTTATTADDDGNNSWASRKYFNWFIGSGESGGGNAGFSCCFISTGNASANKGLPATVRAHLNYTTTKRTALTSVSREVWSQVPVRECLTGSWTLVPQRSDPIDVL